jgi:hypothetical protein
VGFVLKLRGYLDGDKIAEIEEIQEGVVVSFDRYFYIKEDTNVSEAISTFVMPLEFATVKNIIETVEIVEQPVPFIIHRKSALKQTTDFDYFPIYAVREYKIDLSTITYLDEIVMYKDEWIIHQRCTRKPLITTKYTYSPDGLVPVVVNYIDALLGKIELANAESPKKVSSNSGLSIRKNMHQINKNPFPNQGEIGASPQDRCIKFGVITRDKEVYFTITSGEPYDLKVSELLIPVWFGIELSDIGIGTILPAGGTLTFMITAFATKGRRDVRDVFTIKFDEVIPRYGSFQQVSICVDIHRRQAADILIIPDKGTYSENIEYKTLEFKSSTNKVTTKVMMQNWKYSCKYDVTMHRTDYHKSFINIFKVAKHTVMQHPLWSQVTILEETMGTATYCKCDTTGCDFREQEWAFIYVAPDEYYLRKINQITDEGLFFDGYVTAPKGSFVIPAFPALVKAEIKTNYIGERFIKGSIEVFEFREGRYYVPY